MDSGKLNCSTAKQVMADTSGKRNSLPGTLTGEPRRGDNPKAGLQPGCRGRWSSRSSKGRQSMQPANVGPALITEARTSKSDWKMKESVSFDRLFLHLSSCTSYFQCKRESLRRDPKITISDCTECFYKWILFLQCSDKVNATVLKIESINQAKKFTHVDLWRMSSYHLESHRLESFHLSESNI